MKKTLTFLCTGMVALFIFCACGTLDVSSDQNNGVIPKEDRNIDKLSDAVDVILEKTTSDFIGNYPVTDNFFYWIAKTYGYSVVFDIVSEGNVADKEIWFQKTGNSIYVLWQQYCQTTGLDAYDYSRVHFLDTQSKDKIVFDFCGDVNLCEEAATTLYMEQQENGILDCFSEELLSEMNNADVFVVNNEFTYTTRGEPLEGKAYTFRANPDRVDSIIALGTDLVTLANNHVWDYGLIGLTDTLDTLESKDLSYVGAGRNLTEAMRPQYYIANGRKIAIVNATQIERSYTYTRQATEDTAGVLKTLDSTLFCNVISQAKKNADAVIVCVHWGTEGNAHYGADQVRLAADFVNAGADAVVGGHTHCLQGIEYIEDVPIYYSLGNYWFATTANMPADYETGLARIEISSDLSVTPIFIPAKFSKGVTYALQGEEKDVCFQNIIAISETTTISKDGIIDKK